MCVFSLLLIKKLSGLQTKEIPIFWGFMLYNIKWG